MRLYCSCNSAPRHSCLAGTSRPVDIRLGGSRRKTWRVVFSSTGDLTPESGAVRHGGLPRYAWLEAARRPLRIAVDSLAAVLVPSNCRICDQALVCLTRIPVCDPCLNSLNRAEVLSCSICGEALDFLPPEAPTLCSVCHRLPPRFDFAVSFAGYHGALRRVVHLLKYERLRPAAQVLGARLAMAIEGHSFEGDQPVLLVPVPLHRTKRRQRGFNQSELIAHCALKHLPDSRFELHSGNLRRKRATVSQTGLTRHQRRENVRGAFVVSCPERLNGRSALIVDDVYTTGTTLNECARVIRAAGAKQVVVATVARVYRPVAELVAGAVLKQEGSASVLVPAVGAKAVAG